MDFNINSYKRSSIDFDVTISTHCYGMRAPSIRLELKLAGHKTLGCENMLHEEVIHSDERKRYLEHITRQMANNIAAHIVNEFNLVDIFDKQLTAAEQLRD